MILIVGAVAAIAVVGLVVWRRSGASNSSPAAGADAHVAKDRPPPETPERASAAAAPVSSEPAFDPVLAQSLCGDDPDLLAEILTEMRVECSSQVAAIHTALAEGSAPQAHVAAHRLKGSLLMIAAAPAAELAATIERLALGEKLAEVPELLAKLEQELARLEQAIAEHQ